MRPDDIGLLAAAADPRVSPDGRWVACVVSRVDLEANRTRTAVWIAAADGSTPARPLTAGDRDASPRWSPDGRFLAYTADGDDGTAVRLLPVDEPGEAVTVATWPEAVTDLAWSPDGTRLAFVARVRGEGYDPDPRRHGPRVVTSLQAMLDDVGWTAGRRQQVLMVPATGTEPPRPLTDADVDHHGVAWWPDGSAVVTAAGRHDGADLDFQRDLYRVPADGGRPVRLTTGGRAASHPAVDRHGRIAFLVEPVTEGGNTRVHVLEPDETGWGRVLGASLDRTFAPTPGARPPVWDGDRLITSAEDRGRVPVLAVALDADDPTVLVPGDRWVTGFDLAGGTLAFTATDATRPAELFTVVDGVERRLTAVGDPLVARCRPRAPERFVARHPDGTDIDGWLLRPPPGTAPDGARLPVLLNIHGGPFTQYGERFLDEVHLQAAAGFAVVFGNPRGSSGRDDDWGRAVRSPLAEVWPGAGWGGVDAEDVLAVLDHALAANPDLDPDRVGVLGGSYGGFMTTWLIAHHPHRFRAACSERAVNDLVAEDLTADIAGSFPFELGIDHLDDETIRAELARMSPITSAAAIETPLLIVHSEHDWRCPVGQAWSLFTVLRRMRRDVTFACFPAEGHELSRSGAPVHRRQRAELILGFFRRHLQGG